MPDESKLSTVGDGVRRVRAKLGWSQAGLGERLGVTGGTVGVWERDKCTPRVNQLKALCDLCAAEGLSEMLGIFSGAIEARGNGIEQRIMHNPRTRVRGTHLDAMFALADAIVEMAHAVKYHRDGVPQVQNFKPEPERER